MFPRHRSVLLAALSLSAAAVAASPAAAPALADIPAPMIATGECITGAPADKPTPISTTTIADTQSRVDIRTSLKVRRGRIGPVVVKGCVSAIKPMIARTYVLVRAPSSPRYLVALTRWTTASGSAGKLAAPKLTTEAAFTAAVRPLAQRLTIPGIKGTVYGPVGSPLALMARTASGKPYSAKAKQKLAKAYVATGGYAQQTGL